MNAILREIQRSPSLNTLPLRVEEGYLPALITQTTGAMRAVTAALLRKSCSRPVAVVCADDAAASTLAADLRALLGEEVTVLTSRDPVLRDTEVVSRQSEQQRLRALDAVASGAGVCVLTAAGLTERTLPPDVLADTAFTLAVGEGNGPEALEPRLLACGYRRGDMVEGPGQFSRRGGILDIFSPGADRPVRAEFWGDEIDSMGFFDTDTQRRTENIQSFRVLPACEALTSVRDGSALAGTLEGRARTLARRAGGEEAAARLRRDAERIREGASLPWADRYLPYIYEDYTRTGGRGLFPSLEGYDGAARRVCPGDDRRVYRGTLPRIAPQHARLRGAAAAVLRRKPGDGAGGCPAVPG